MQGLVQLAKSNPNFRHCPNISYHLDEWRWLGAFILSTAQEERTGRYETTETEQMLLQGEQESINHTDVVTQPATPSIH